MFNTNENSTSEIPTLDQLNASPAAATPSAPWWQRVALGLGFAGIIAGGAFGYSAVSNASAAGSDTALEAVQEFMTAVDNEDAIGAAEALDPGERDLALEYMPSYLDEIRRIGLVQGEVDLNNLEGADIKSDPAELDYEETVLGDTTTLVKVTGMEVSIDLDNLPMGDNLRDLAADEFDADHTETIDELPLVAVQREGGWYVSIAYSTAEFALDASGWDRDTDIVIDSNGSATASDAATQLFREVAEGDGLGIIGTLDPVEAAVLYDYFPIVFANNGGQTSWEWSDDGDVTIASLSWDETGEGNRRQLTLDGADFTITGLWDDGTDQQILYADNCVSLPGADDKLGSDQGFTPEEVEMMTEGVCADPGADTDTPEWALAQADDSFTLDVVQRDGEWFVAPAHTMAEWGLTNLAGISDDAVNADDEDFLPGGVGGIASLVLGMGIADSDIEAEWIEDGEWDQSDWIEEGDWIEDGEVDFDFTSDDFDFTSDDFEFRVNGEVIEDMVVTSTEGPVTG